MAVSTSGTSPQSLIDIFARELPAGRLLNLGSGTTTFSAIHEDVVNVDYAHIPGSPVDVVADGLCLPFRDSVFDGALLKDVIEHVLDAIALLREVGRVCRPGAVIVITTPRAVPRAVWDDPTHIRGFTASALTSALELAGWTVDRPPARIGGFPGAGRLRLYPHLEKIMRVPLLGHYWGTNWLVRARLAYVRNAS